MTHSPTRPTNVRWGVLGMLSTAAILAYVDRLVISNVVIELQEELGLTPNQAGWILASFLIGYGTMQVPMGRLGDLRLTRWVLPVIVIAWSVMTGLTAVASTFAGLCLVRCGLGMAQSGVFPLTLPALQRWFPVGSRATAQGIVISCMQIGALLSGLLATAIALYGWHRVFVICGLAGVAWSVFFAWWFRDRPEDHRGANDAEVRLIGDTTVTVAQVAPLPWRRLVSEPNVLGLCLGQIFVGMGTYLYYTWFPTLLRERYGFELAGAGLLTMVPYLGGWLGAVLGGRIVDLVFASTGSLGWSRRGVWFTGVSLAAMLYWVAAWLENPFVVVGVIGVAATCASAGLPALWAAIGDIGGEHAGVLFAVQNAVGCVGAGICPLLVPQVVERWGWSTVLPVFGGIFMIGAVSWVLVNPARPLTPPPRPFPIV